MRFLLRHPDFGELGGNRLTRFRFGTERSAAGISTRLFLQALEHLAALALGAQVAIPHGRPERSESCGLRGEAFSAITLALAMVSCEMPAARASSFRVSVGFASADICGTFCRPPCCCFSLFFAAMSGSSFSANSARWPRPATDAIPSSSPQRRTAWGILIYAVTMRYRVAPARLSPCPSACRPGSARASFRPGPSPPTRQAQMRFLLRHPDFGELRRF